MRPHFISSQSTIQVAQCIRLSIPELQAARVRSPGREDTLAEEMATHPSNLARIIPWAEEPGRLQSMGLKKSQT